MSDIASKPDGRSVTVTVKYGKGYDESWVVFRGLPAEVREDIAAYFGIDQAAIEGLTLNELVGNVTKIAHGNATAGAILGATAIPSSASTPPASVAAANGHPASEGGGDVWAQAAGDVPAAEAEPEGPNPILAQIEQAADVPALQRLWAENQEAFGDADVMAAYKARGKALQAAA